jgi:aldose 1-epimerase
MSYFSKIFTLSSVQLALLVGLGFSSCSSPQKQDSTSEKTTFMIQSEFLTEYLGQPVYRYVLDNGTMQVELSNFGGLISKITVPDREGKMENVALTFDRVEDFMNSAHPFFGVAVGRVANRIANAEFTLEGKNYTLAKTNGDNHLHGGQVGFDKKVWKSETYSTDSTVGVKMTYLSVDGEEGYPGNLFTTLWMELGTDNALNIRFESTTDQATPINLTNHTYFNLGGMKRDVLDHEFQFWADAYTPIDEELIPTGEVRNVEGSPFDFRSPKLLGDQIAALGGGFDHNLVLKKEASLEMKQVARVRHAASGRVMEMFSDNVGVQFYTGNFLSKVTGAVGQTYDKHWGFCLESQNWPDAVHHDNFPNSILSPGQTYAHHISYRFSVD